jgi:hypothetical protein
MGALIEALRTDLRGLGNNLKQALYVEWQRAQLRAVDLFFRAALYTCLLGFGLTAAISASLLVVHGIQHALADMSGAEWVGELGAGFAVFAFILAAGLVARAQLRRQLVRKARRSLARRAQEREARRAGIEGA